MPGNGRTGSSPGSLAPGAIDERWHVVAEVVQGARRADLTASSTSRSREATTIETRLRPINHPHRLRRLRISGLRRASSRGAVFLHREHWPGLDGLPGSRSSRSRSRSRSIRALGVIVGMSLRNTSSATSAGRSQPFWRWSWPICANSLAARRSGYDALSHGGSSQAPLPALSIAIDSSDPRGRTRTARRAGTNSPDQVRV
jgi:hypothetical protein